MMKPNSCNIKRELRALLGYGRLTPRHGVTYVRSYKAAQSHVNSTGNHWSSTENSSTNSWNVNFANGNSNNNNKYNSNVVRPAVADPTKAWLDLRRTLQFAYEECRQGKSSSKQYADYVLKADEDLDLLTTELMERTYQPSTSTCFLVKYPKLREVFAAAFRDRIIHHWICARLNPLFEELNWEIGNVTHNCRKNFGTSSAVYSVYQAIKYVTYDYGREAYIFKGDLVGFFMSLPQQRLRDQLLDFTQTQYRGRFKNLLMWLIDVVVMHRPELNCMFNSDPKEWRGLAHNKSLFRSGPDRGAPIGNLTTQLFANFYMADLDAYMVKCINELKAKRIRAAYHRFVDDFIIVCSDKEELRRLIKLCEWKIQAMDLTIHKDKRYIQPASHGVLFVGTYIKNGRLYLSNRTVGRFQNKVTEILRFLEAHSNNVMYVELQKIMASLNSYLGFCQHHRSFRLRRKIMRPLRKCEAFTKYFRIDMNYTKVTLKKKWKTIIM